MIIKDTESVDIPTSTGPMRTYLFRPVAEGRYPGLLLFSEIFQVTGPIRRMTAMLASHGFVVAVPEIYHELEPASPRVPILITPSPSFQPLISLPRLSR
jgi:carboxymethylenebutenolidase